MLKGKPREEVFVETAAALRDLSQGLQGAERIGLDTEFVGERTYFPRLELIQLATENGTAVIDCQSVGTLQPLLDVICRKDIEKVVHAGQQDLDLLNGLAGKVPSPVFDTQIAAAMIGLGAQPGYAALVERLLHVSVEKTETLTDWSRRPLSPEQLAYAHDDVRHLLPLQDRLLERLEKLGRVEWLREELRRLESLASYARAPVEEIYLRVRGRGGLRPRNLAILRELAAWREQEAQKRDKPRGSVLSDDLLVEIARRAPESTQALRKLRGRFARAVERHAEAIVAAVQRALALPREQWPRPPSTYDSVAIEPGIVEVLQAVLRLNASRAQIAPAMVATSADLHELVEARAAAREIDLPLLRGWRYEVAGRSLVELLEGSASLRIDPLTMRLRLDTDRRPGAPEASHSGSSASKSTS